MRLKHQLAGRLVELTRLDGMNTDLGMGETSTSPIALVKVTGRMDGFCLRGRTVPRDPYEEGAVFETRTPGLYGVSLDTAYNHKKPLRLKLALTPRRTVEFLVPASRGKVP
jgi:hypothetical protein